VQQWSFFVIFEVLPILQATFVLDCFFKHGFHPLASPGCYSCRCRVNLHSRSSPSDTTRGQIAISQQ
jgi:hypothetical protein